MKERDVMKEAEDNLASVKATLAAIDDLSKRWEVYNQLVYIIFVSLNNFLLNFLECANKVCRSATRDSGVGFWS